MSRRQHFWHRRCLIVSVIFALTGMALGLVVVFGSKVSPITQVFTWACGGCSVTLTLADWRKTGRFGNAQFQAFLLGAAALAVELLVLVAAAAAALAVLWLLLSEATGC